MPVGVDGFVPARLRMARAARGLKQKELADLVDRVEGTISKWESLDYDQRPDTAALIRLSEILETDPSWFFKPVTSSNGAAFFRSLKSELGRMRDKAEAKLGFVESIHESLAEYIELPPVDIPDLLNGRDFRTLRTEDIEHVASEIRAHWDLDDEPIEDLLLVIENAGVVVAEDEIGSAKLDGVSRWASNGRPFTLLARDKSVGVRRRFDAAHELGHIILHKNVNQNNLSENFTLIEEQAMLFAGALLLPERNFSDDVYSLSLDTLCAIKSKWKVSIGAMIKRLSVIERISPDYERRLWQYYSIRRWRGFEPLDDEIAIEHPQNLKTSIEMIVGEGISSRGDLLKNIGLKAKDVTALVGLPNEYFDKSDTNIVRLKPAVKQISKDNQAEGNILPFSRDKR